MSADAKPVITASTNVVVKTEATATTQTVVKQHTAAELSGALAGSPEERREETRTITLTMKNGIRPDVMFSGFWDGRSIKAAMNSIAKAYRVRKMQVMHRPTAKPQQLPGATLDTKSPSTTGASEKGK